MFYNCLILANIFQTKLYSVMVVNQNFYPYYYLQNYKISKQLILIKRLSVYIQIICGMNMETDQDLEELKKEHEVEEEEQREKLEKDEE